MKLIVAFRNFLNAPSNCTFCPHSAFCVFNKIHSINAGLSVQQRSHVSCAVKTEYLAMRPGGRGRDCLGHIRTLNISWSYFLILQTCVIDRVTIYSSLISLKDKLKKLAQWLECHQSSSIPARSKYFSFLHSDHTGPGAITAFYRMVPRERSGQIMELTSHFCQ
jgi:hypothetical protein